jgi:hypothetical protein
MPSAWRGWPAKRLRRSATTDDRRNKRGSGGFDAHAGRRLGMRCFAAAAFETAASETVAFGAAAFGAIAPEAFALHNRSRPMGRFAA